MSVDFRNLQPESENHEVKRDVEDPSGPQSGVHENILVGIIQAPLSQLVYM
jgi:hypothetical protein